MKVPDRNLHELREQRFTIVEGFLSSDELKAAQEALWLHYPRPEEYFADPSAHQEYTRSQFDGSRMGPWQSWDLNRLAFHPDLLDLAERFLGSADLHLCNAELGPSTRAPSTTTRCTIATSSTTHSSCPTGPTPAGR